jgi:iron complex outermembrane receptor protein
MGAQFRSSLWFAFVLVLLGAAPLAAQTGSLTGRVTDGATGTPLPGARIDLVNTAGQSSGSSISDREGQFRLASVPSGSYTLVVTLIGYENRRIEGVQIMAGQTSMQAITLDIAAFELNPIIVSASKRQEKAIDAPASVAVVDSRAIAERPTVTPVDHLTALPGVDVMRSGVQSTNVVVRGFNNVFSGALHTLTDNRIAGVPSLRLNALHFIPANDDDIDRMEVVLGPGAALYGPNTANGVLHIVTKSPLDAPGSTVSIAGGQQSVLHAQFRTAHRLSDQLGFKISGQYMQAKEWEHVDQVEAAEKAKFASNPFFKTDLMNATGISGAEADRRIALIGNRDFDVQRMGFEGRLDWRPSAEGSVILSGGTNVANGIELTGLGAGQAVDWRSSYFQARGNWNRLFVQGYVNASDAGDTYLLRNGAPITDQSKLYVGQIQHGFSLGERQSFTYGMDLLYTNPVTNGSINGKYEDDDQTTEFGAYLQSETMLHQRLNLVLAGRLDNHSALPENIFSPRAALVFKPTESQAFRVTFNRAFSTPTSLNQFLDLGSAIPNESLARLGYSLRVQGTGTQGFRFKQANGGYMMRSPFTPAALGGPSTPLPANAAAFYAAALQVVAQQAAAAGTPIPTELVQYLSSLTPTSAEISTVYSDIATGASGLLSSLNLSDVKPMREETSTTFEVGYKGLIGERVLLTGDVWFSRRQNLITPLTIGTPLLMLNGSELITYLQPHIAGALMSTGVPAAIAAEEAMKLAGQLGSGMARVPVGVISSEDVNANGAQILTTYYNVDDELDLWGTDLSAMALISDDFSLTGTLSLVNKDQFETKQGTSVTLNAPKMKGSVALGYRNNDNGFNGELRTRFNEGFPVRSGVYNGTICLGEKPEDGAEECVKRSTLLDLTLGYRLPIQGTSLQLSVQNLLDEKYRSFPGVPQIGRMALLRLKYDF